MKNLLSKLHNVSTEIARKAISGLITEDVLSYEIEPVSLSDAPDNTLLMITENRAGCDLLPGSIIIKLSHKLKTHASRLPEFKKYLSTISKTDSVIYLNIAHIENYYVSKDSSLSTVLSKFVNVETNETSYTVVPCDKVIFEGHPLVEDIKEPLLCNSPFDPLLLTCFNVYTNSLHVYEPSNSDLDSGNVRYLLELDGGSISIKAEIKVEESKWKHLCSINRKYVPLTLELDPTYLVSKEIYGNYHQQKFNCLHEKVAARVNWFRVNNNILYTKFFRALRLATPVRVFKVASLDDFTIAGYYISLLGDIKFLEMIDLFTQEKLIGEYISSLLPKNLPSKKALFKSIDTEGIIDEVDLEKYTITLKSGERTTDPSVSMTHLYHTPTYRSKEMTNISRVNLFS